MAHATADDGVRLYYEETGSGRTVIFVHERPPNVSILPLMPGSRSSRPSLPAHRV